MPGLALLDGVFNDPEGNRVDEVAELKRGNEFYGTHGAAHWILPAQQRFETDDLVAGEVELGLVVQNEFVAGQGFAQVGQHQ